MPEITHDGRFDYDAAIRGLKAVDRHTLRIGLTAVDYTLPERLASLPSFAVAREAVEALPAYLYFDQGNLDYVSIGGQILPRIVYSGKLQVFNLGIRALDPSGYQIPSTLWSKTSPFGLSWKYLDIDLERQAAARKQGRGTRGNLALLTSRPAATRRTSSS